MWENLYRDQISHTKCVECMFFMLISVISYTDTALL